MPRHRPRPYDHARAQRVLDRIAAGALLRDLWRDPALLRWHAGKVSPKGRGK